jgi:sulfate adenylyltransferase subunit 1
MNEIGLVEAETRQLIRINHYSQIRGTGAFVLIDHQSNATVAADMVREIYNDEPHLNGRGPVTAARRSERWGHDGEVVELNASAEIADALEHALFDPGAITVRVLLCAPAIHALMATSGILGLVHHESEAPADLKIGDAAALEINVNDMAAAVASILKHFRNNEILQSRGMMS